MATTPHPAGARGTLPRAPGFDNSLALLAEGYQFMSQRHAALGSDAFATRLMLRPVLCVRGEDAARMFYQPGRFTRRRAIPPNALALLQDVGSAQTMDGEAHRRRKAMLMSLLGPLERQRLVGLAQAQWRAQFARWPQLPQVSVHRAAEEVMCRAACQWAGIPLGADEVLERTAALSKTIAAAGAVGPRKWCALPVRSRTGHWARALVDAVRAGSAQPPFDSALNVIARHRDADGRLVNRKHAAMELINLLRPIVEVARFVAFGVLALHQNPQYRERIAGDDAFAAMFTREVRRYYPIFPAVGGRATHDFEWHGRHIAKGTWVLLDLYGTDHHPAIWGDPEVFRPERFEHWESKGSDLLPQGGGDYYAGQRCARELASIELVKSALRLFATEIDYAVPPQDLRVSLRRMPTLPASGMVIQDVGPSGPQGSQA